MAAANTNARKKKSPGQSGILPPWLLVLISLVYYETVFQIWTAASPTVPRELTVGLFTLAFALLTALFATVGRRQGLHSGLAILIAAVWGVFYLLEYFILDAFKNFYTVEAIFSGAGNAGQEDFAARVFGLVAADFWRILVFCVPIVLWLLVNSFARRPRVHTRGVRRYLFSIGLAFLTIAVFTAFFISPDTKKLSTEYSFTEAVHDFGLPTGLVLEQVNAGQDKDVLVVDSGSGPRDWDPKPTTPATEPASTEPAETDSVPDTTQPIETQTPTETEAPTEPPAPEPVYQVMDLDFKALADKETNSKLANVHRYVDSLTPTKTNAMTGRFAGKNLILISAEAFSLEVIDPELTPTLYRMATRGIHFTDYYQPAWGGSTSTGEFSNLIGLVPTHGVTSMTQDTIGMNLYFTMGNQLQRQGYFSRAYHNNSYTYYNRDKTHENLGYEKWIAMGNGMEEGVKKTWPESDREMIDFTLPKYIDQQPFSIYYMTVSGHGLYSWGGNYMSAKNRDAVAHLDCSDTIKAYYAANLELEYAMADLIAGLEEAGIADDTVIVLGADHYPYSLDKSTTWGNEKDYLEELYGYPADTCFARDHNGLIIWSGCIEDEGIEVTTPVYSLDILPTLSNLFGLEWDSRLLVGRDVFSEAEPIVLWPNHSWKTDLGSYNAATGVFTPAEGAQIPKGYQDRISGIVRNKINFSDAVLNYDYYGVLFGKK